MPEVQYTLTCRDEDAFADPGWTQPCRHLLLPGRPLTVLDPETSSIRRPFPTAVRDGLADCPAAAWDRPREDNEFPFAATRVATLTA